MAKSDARECATFSSYICTCRSRLELSLMYRQFGPEMRLLATVLWSPRLSNSACLTASTRSDDTTSVGLGRAGGCSQTLRLWLGSCVDWPPRDCHEVKRLGNVLGAGIMTRPFLGFNHPRFHLYATTPVHIHGRGPTDSGKLLVPLLFCSLEALSKERAILRL